MFEKIKSLWPKKIKSAYNDPLDKYFEGEDQLYYISSYSTAGIMVTPLTALEYSAVTACIRIISKTISSLNWKVYQKLGDRRKERRNHHIQYLLDFPNREICSNTFKSTILTHALLWGNGYAEIERNRNGDPIALWILEPTHVKIKRDDQNNLFYEIQSNNKVRRLDPEDIFHLKDITISDGTVGTSRIFLAKRSIGLGIAQEQFGAKFFANGTQLSGVLEHPGSLSEVAVENIKKSWRQRYSGISNSHDIAVLGEGMKFEKISTTPEESQFNDSRIYQVNEIARWFGVPPHKIAELSHATFSNIEEQNKEFVDDALIPWVNSLEEEVLRKLFTQREVGLGYYSKIDLRTLLRGNAQARSAYYREGIQNGWFSVNEVRALEDMNPIEGGDKHFIQLNMTTIDQAGVQPQQTQQPQQNSGKGEKNVQLILGDGIERSNGIPRRY